MPDATSNDEWKRAAAETARQRGPNDDQVTAAPAPAARADKQPDDHAKWGEAVADKTEEETAKVAAGKTYTKDAVYDVRQTDNYRRTAENTAAMAQLQAAERDQKVKELAEEHTKKLIDQAREFEQIHTRFEALGQNPIDLVDGKIAYRSDGKINSNDYYQRALAEQRDDRDPAGTLARTAMAEHAAFLRDQEQFDERIKKAADLDSKHSLQQRKEIQAADYLASTGDRIADQSEILTGSQFSEDAVEYRERAAEQSKRSEALQESYRQRTGREASTATANELNAERTETASKGEERERETASGGVESDWKPAGVEITDAMQERLANLQERHNASGGMESTSIGATRPFDGGRSGL